MIELAPDFEAIVEPFETVKKRQKRSRGTRRTTPQAYDSRQVCCVDH